jgi:hypothetical protein
MATALVNKHITRVLAAGGTVAESAWLISVDAWLTSEVLYANLVDWSSAAFGVVKNGSNEISKIMGLGTTWLPRLGDLTPAVPASTLYDATGISSKPCWTNTASGAYSYYGAARAGTIRADNIRRKHNQGLTVVAVHKKSGTNTASFLGCGQFGNPYVQVTSGSPGSCKIGMGPMGSTAFTDTHGTTLTNNVVNIVGGTFDGDEVLSYVEGVAGLGSAGYVSTNTDSNSKHLRPLLGSANLNGQHYYQWVHGSQEAINTNGQTTTARAISGTLGHAVMSCSDLIIFDTCLTPTQMASLNTLLRTRY